jgi:5-dehydro-4-deoxyglucarate dehydratase
MTASHALLKERLSRGVLAFPATAFKADLSLDLASFEAHVADLAAARPCALVPAGGAGELFSLDAEEHAAVIAASVRHAGGIPVVAGIGGGMMQACAMARAAAKAGADALLVLPPYLVAGEQEGLARHVRHICAATDLPVIVYSRDNAIFSAATVLRLAETCPTLLGLKDGTGDFEMLLELKLGAGDRLLLVNGVPTAEILAAQTFAIGITAYSSAVFAFWPAMARDFYASIESGDAAVRDRLLREFYLPLTAIRRRRRGYAVAIVKAGLDAMGRPAGPVRPPLVDLASEDRQMLVDLVARNRARLEASRSA